MRRTFIKDSKVFFLRWNYFNRITIISALYKPSYQCDIPVYGVSWWSIVSLINAIYRYTRRSHLPIVVSSKQEMVGVTRSIPSPLKCRGNGYAHDYFTFTVSRTKYLCFLVQRSPNCFPRATDRSRRYFR